MMPTLPDPIDRLKASLSDRYAIEREIGRGGMATVYLARDLKHERRVALKVLRPELSTALGAQRFLREVRIAARLQHPHIVPIFDSGEAGGLLYCVMPYVEGQTLRELLEREKRLPLEDALQIARNVAHALSYAHAHGIIHRDIKPENILISQGYAVVADFGIARALTEAGGEGLTQTGIAIGTPTYMSPEQLEAGAQIDGRSDLYSLGCVLYEMLAGQPPFTGPSVQVIMARHLMDPVPSLRSARSEVPEPLESAIAKSLAKAPAERFSTGEQFVNALATPVTTPPDQPVAVLPDWVTPSFFAELRRRRVDRAAVLYAAITLGAVLVAGLIFRALDFPAWAFHVVVVAAVIGFPVSLVLAWMYDLTAEGLRRTTPMRLKWTPPDSARLEVTPTTPTEAAWETEETVPMRTPERVHEEDRVLTPGQAVGAAVPMVDEGVSLLDSRLGLISLLGVALLVNWVETALETWVSANLDVVSEFRHQAAYAVHWIEGFYHFDYHDVTNALATYGYSSAYFFVWPLLFVLVGFALARREDISAFRVFSFAALIDYAISLPFFILFPVPERWAYSGSGAMLLSDRWSSQLIELVRPLSALDNCFPSFHVSLTVVIILLSFLYRLRLRRSVAALGLTIILSTFVLGIHWLADIIAGLAVGTLSVVLALRLNERVAGPAVPARQPFTVKMGRVTLTCLAAVLSLASSVSAAPQHEVTFIEVALDEETRRADGQLRAYLEEKAGIVAVSQRPMEYDVVIDRLAGWDVESKGDFLARMTPYALVAAELLGADLEILATYVSRATGSTTYHSYFVVNRDRFSYTPELATLVEFLKDQESPASFIYHNRFSTSSYFLPALFFREHGIFNMAQSTEYHTAIHSKKLGNSSSDLVRGVAAGQYDLAAVWDGTKTKFEVPGDLYEEYGSRVHFVQLPTELPNDLLVASAAMDSSILTRIRVAIDSMAPDQIDEGDFLTWRNINEAPDARRALANLRWLARERPAPVTVDVRASSIDETPVPQEYLEAARQAVRLSGTEFVNYDGDFHAHRDYIWTLSPIHDGAVLVTSRIAGSDIDDQEFQISFRDTEDLTRRIGNLIHTRLHRIRYVWPYRTEHPTVIRDVGFNMPLDASVKVRKITWLDAPRNLFLEDAEFDANVSHADFYKFELYPDFATASGDDVFGFDAMSNVSYRVILVREVRERPIFRILTVVFVVLLATAALAALVDLRRRKPEVTSGP